MFFKTFILPSLNSLGLTDPVIENFQVKEALRNSFSESFPLNVSISFSNPLTNDIDHISLVANRCNGSLYEMTLPDLECLENVYLSFSSPNNKIPLMMDFLIPPTITPLIQNNTINSSIRFLLRNIVGPQKIYIINKPVFKIETEYINEQVNITLTHIEGNQEIYNRFSYIDHAGRIKNMKVTNKLGYLNTGELTQSILIKELLNKDLKIRQRNTKTIQKSLKKALAALENINIRDSLRKYSLKTQVKPGCICDRCSCEKKVTKNLKEEKQGTHRNEYDLNICPISQIECLKYGLNTTVNCFDILQVLLFDTSLPKTFSVTKSDNEESIENLLRLIDTGKDVFEIRAYTQLFLSEVNDDFDYKSINVSYDLVRSKILQSTLKQPISTESKISDDKINEESKEKTEENENDKETEEDANSEPSDDKKEPKSRVVLWVSLAVSGIVVIAIIGYLFLM